MKKIRTCFTVALLALMLTGCKTSMNKDELKASYFKIQDSYAKVLTSSSKDGVSAKKTIPEIKESKNVISKEINKLKMNTSNVKLTNQLIKYGNSSKKSLDSIAYNIKGVKNKYADEPLKNVKLSYSISNRYFDNEYSEGMTKVINASAFSQKPRVTQESSYSSTLESSSSSVVESSSSAQQPDLSNASIQEAIESADSGIDVESVNGSYTDADSTVQIVLNGRELASNKQAERAMLMDISTVWKTVKDNFDYSKISNIGVSVKYPLKDEGGNTSSEYVIKSDISGSKLDQLNSDGFNYKNVPNFATNWWQSEALPKL